MKNAETILLSISMLISGKEDMQKSLNSLLYFKKAFPTEIILVDTGCNSQQRAMAEDFADKIIDFEWCNDFAAARNAGLKEAHGKWFMFLDDDEWFDNPQEIIQFFLSGEYKEYNCASYVVRNYMDAAGTVYDDTYPSRMVKLEKDTRFVGKIHEYIDPYRLPKKSFSDFVHHYGYVYKNEQERKKHSTRNMQPLIEMCKEHPGDPRWVCQLAQEYYAADNHNEVFQTCKTGLSEWNKRKKSIEYAPAHIGALYAYILVSLELEEKYAEEEKWLKKALEEPIINLPYMKPTVAFLCLEAAGLYNNLQNFNLCWTYFRRYLDYFEIFKNDRDAIEAGTATITARVFQMRIVYGAILMCMESGIRLQDYILAEKAFFMIDWTDRRLLHQTKYEKKIVDACCNVSYHPLWVKILQTLVAREDGMKEMYVVFLETEIAYKEQEEKEKLSRFYRLVAEIDFEHRYILCCRILWTAENPELEADERKQQLLALFTELFDKYADELFDIKSEIWDLAKRMEIPMESNLLKISYRVWRRMLERWSREATPEEFVKWNARILTWQTVADIRYQLFNVKYEEGYLRTCQKSQIALEELEKLLWKYADDVITLYKPYYREFVFTDAVDMLPEEAQLALKLKRLQEYRQQGNAKQILIQIKECITIYPPMEATINDYAGRVRDEIQMQIQKQSAEKTELENLVITLKSVARLHIQQGEWQAAEEILHQIQVCMPGDSEVGELLEQIAKIGGR